MENHGDEEDPRENTSLKPFSGRGPKIQDNMDYRREPSSEKERAIASSEEYDPFLDRYVERPTNNLETLVNFVKGCLGTGILTMPKAFANSGYIVGVICMPIIAGISVYCKHILLNSAYELCRRKKIPSVTLKESVSAACSEGPKSLRRFSVLAGQIVEWVVFVNQIGVGVAFHVFIADNIKGVCDEYLGKYDIRIYVAIIYIPLVLINLLRDLKILAPFSLVANLLSFLCFGIILYYVFSTVTTLDDKRMAGDAVNFPLFMCTAVFSVEMIALILPVQNTMKRPQDLVGPFGVLNQSMIIIIALYAAMGFFGYMAYGDTVSDSITLSLPNTTLAQSVRVMYPVAIAISYALQMYISVDILWNGYLVKRYQKHKCRLLIECLVRTALVTVTLILGVAIRNLELIISLVGALSFSLLGLVLPAVIELFTYWNHPKGFKLYYVVTKDILLMCFGFITCVIGTYTSLKKIIETF